MYSPKVIYGIDFHPREPEPVFLISVQPTGLITLNALALAQQTNRNRDIEEIHYFIKADPRERFYQTFDDVYEFYSSLITTLESCLYLERLTENTNNVTRELHNGYHIQMNDSGELGISKTIHTETMLNIELDNDMLSSNMMYYYTSRLEEKGFKIFYTKEESNMITKKQKEVAKNLAKEETEFIISNILESDETLPKYAAKAEDIKRVFFFPLTHLLQKSWIVHHGSSMKF